MIEHPHVDLRDGVAWITGTKVPVHRIYRWHKHGVAVDTLLKRYPNLQPSQVLSALAFSYDNVEIVASAMEQENRILGITK